MTDEATITVIATGLEEVPVPKQMVGGMSTLMKYNNQPQQRTATVNGLHSTAATSSTATPVRPAAARPAAAPAQTTQTSSTPNFSGIQKPRQPESSVKPVEINIPDFLRNSRR
jgi:cell division protein FtsZ